jgi:hypothetical protein
MSSHQVISSLIRTTLSCKDSFAFTRIDILGNQLTLMTMVTKLLASYSLEKEEENIEHFSGIGF